MTTAIHPTDDLDHLRDLTERYARYSRGAGGLSLVLGGVLLLGAFLIGATLPLGPGMRIALACLPAAWLLSKELLRRGYYQRDGVALQQVSPTLRRQRRWMAIYLFAIAALVVGGVLWMNGLALPPPGILAYLLLVAALPFAAMRWFWSVGDFLVGVLLFCQAAVVSAGGAYGGAWLLYVAGCAGIAIVVGVREHREYLALRAALRGAAA